jgi:hypothetical protein
MLIIEKNKIKLDEIFFADLNKCCALHVAELCGSYRFLFGRGEKIGKTVWRDQKCK